MSGQISEKPILTELSERLSRPVDDIDLQRARLHLLDWLGCAIAGAVKPAGRVLLARPIKDLSGQAFVWGGLGNILEMDDVDKRALLHPGPSIIPAALAVAGAHSASMSDLLTAIVRGYEATICLGRAVGRAHYALWHSTGTCGAIGAARAAAHILGLNENETAHAMSLALSQAAGLWHTRHDPSSMGKQLHTAVASRAGVDAAQLAKAGFKGPLRILEGEQGFFAATCADADPVDILSHRSDRWAIHDVSFKPWPACRHAHAVIDAALVMREKIDVHDTTDFHVRTYADALKFCDQPNPTTIIEAKFSLQHSVAVAILRGPPTLDDFSLAAVNDPALAALRSRVDVEVSAAINSNYPARFGAEISSGKIKEVALDALGDPENPMSEQQICNKAESLMQAGGMSRSARDQMIELTSRGEPDPADLISILNEGLACRE